MYSKYWNIFTPYHACLQSRTGSFDKQKKNKKKKQKKKQKKNG